jgi:cytochrome P450
MFHDADFMPFAPRSRPSLHAAVTNMIENWPPEAYREGHAVIRGVWPMLPATLLLTDPLLIEEVLVTRAEEFVRDRFQTRALSSAFSRKSLFFAEGANWRWQRRAAAPAFRHEKLLGLVPIFSQCAQAQAQEWRNAKNGAVLDMAPAMSKLTLAIILHAVLGQGAEVLDQHKFLAALNHRVSTMAWRFLIARMGLPEATPFPGSRKVAEASLWLSEAISRLVASRRNEGGESKDILALLLSAKDPETGRAMSNAELISNLYMFMVAGNETMATALAWTLWLLAKDQATQERLRAEIQAVVGQRAIGPEDIDRLTFTRQVIQESMRLFPPAFGIGRAPRESITIGPHEVRGGELVIIATWCVHRHEKLWEDPNSFDPDRFAPEKVKSRHRCAHLPFGAGPRVCIGSNFAMLEMTAILATLANGFRFKPVPGHRIALASQLTLRSRNGLPIIIEAL